MGGASYCPTTRPVRMALPPRRLELHLVLSEKRKIKHLVPWSGVRKQRVIPAPALCRRPASVGAPGLLGAAHSNVGGPGAQPPGDRQADEAAGTG